MSLRSMLLALMAIVGLQCAQAANLLVNGGLEDPPCQASVCGFSVPTGWSSATGSIDIVTSSLWLPQEGNQSVDLNATGNGDLYQTFATTPGAMYLVSFYLSGNPFNGPAVKTLNVSAGDTSNNYSFDTTGRDGANMGWTQTTFQFAAYDTTSILFFLSTDAQETNAGPALDNISVELIEGPPNGVPEPSSLAMMFGGAAVVLLSRRLRRTR